MLNTPYIIREKYIDITTLYKNVDDFYIKIELPKKINDDLLEIVINNFISKELYNKYISKNNFFMFEYFKKNIDIKNQYNIITTDIFLKEIKNTFKNLDIFFINYENLDENIRKYVNTLIRCNCICSNGKLLFHIISKLRYKDFIYMNYHFDTFCDKEKLLLNNEIQQLLIYNDIIIDDDK